VTLIHDGIEFDTIELALRGRLELAEDDQHELVLGRTLAITLRGRLVRLAYEPGGQHTQSRVIATVKLDALDQLREGEAIDGQLRLADQTS
jgi:hypothetical protein